MKPSRSMLYIPGDSPGMIQHAPIFGADSILLDLEDAVALTEKDAARRMVAVFLKRFDFNGPEDVLLADKKITEIENRCGLPLGSVKIHAMIETALGLEMAFAIASASPRVSALTIGGQDFTADMGVQKTKEGRELFYARCRVVAAAHAAGVDSYDTVWADIMDNEGLLRETKEIVGLGFTGKACIHPSQIATIHKAFMPAEKELRKAERVVEAAEKAEREGKGVVSVDGKMVDAPVVARSRHLLALAELYGLKRGEL